MLTPDIIYNFHERGIIDIDNDPADEVLKKIAAYTARAWDAATFEEIYKVLHKALGEDFELPNASELGNSYYIEVVKKTDRTVNNFVVLDSSYLVDYYELDATDALYFNYTMFEPGSNLVVIQDGADEACEWANDCSGTDWKASLQSVEFDPNFAVYFPLEVTFNNTKATVYVIIKV